MNPIRRSIAMARTRVFVQDVLDALGWSLLSFLALACLMLLMDRAMALPVPSWSYYAAGALALVLPLIHAWIRRPTPEATAAMIDYRLGLKDRLATALYAAKLPDNPFASHAIEEAQRAATEAKISEGFRLKLRRTWAYMPPLAGVLAVLVVFLQPMDWLGRRAHEARVQAAQAEVEAEEAQVTQAMAVVERLREDAGALEEADAETMRELAELTRRDLSNPQMRRQLAAKVGQVQEKIAQNAEQKQREFETMQNTMSRLDPGRQGPADRFADALRRGDFEAAKAELQALAQEIDKLSPEDREALREQLETLAQQLNDAAAQAAAQQAAAQQQIQQQLQQAGLSQQQIQQLQQQNFDPQAVQQALQQQGMNQQQAQQMAQQIQQQQQQSQNAGQCSSCSGGLSSSLGQMAKSMSQSQSQSQGQGSSQMQQGAQGASDQLSQMAQMQSQLQQMRMSQSQLQQAANALGSQSKSGGVGGSKAGSGEGGNPLGEHRELQGYQSEAKGDIGQGEGKVIASWLQRGEAARGDAAIGFDQAVTEAREAAEQAVTDDRVPRRYHEPIKEYFNQLPTSPDRVTAPPAPR